MSNLLLEKRTTLKKMGHPRRLFGLFQANINTILQQINVKNVHPVYGTGIRTHDLKT